MGYIVREIDESDLKNLTDELTINKQFWDWENYNNPYKLDKPLGWVIEKSGNLVGAITTIPVDIKACDRILKGLWVNRFYVKQNHWGRGAWLFKRLMHCPYLIMGFPNKRAYPFEKKIFFWESGLNADIRQLVTYINILDPKKILGKRIKNKPLTSLISQIVNPFLKLLFNYRKFLKVEGLDIKEINFFDEKVDRLWDEAQGGYDVIVQRKKEYLNWRFIDTPYKHSIEYKIFIAQKNDAEVSGYIVFGLKRRVDLLDAYILDIFTNSDDIKTLQFLIANAIRYCKMRGASSFRCLISPDNKTYEKALFRCGFIFKRCQTNFVGYHTNPEKSKWFFKEFVNAPKRWFITYSDGELGFNI